MISHAQEKWNPTEGHNLAINEIRPLDRFVFGDRQRLLDVIGLMLDVFIEAAGQTQVAQMPVERGLILLCCLRNSGNHRTQRSARSLRMVVVQLPAQSTAPKVL